MTVKGSYMKSLTNEAKNDERDIVRFIRHIVNNPDNNTALIRSEGMNVLEIYKSIEEAGRRLEKTLETKVETYGKSIYFREKIDYNDLGNGIINYRKILEHWSGSIDQEYFKIFYNSIEDFTADKEMLINAIVEEIK